MFALPRVSSLSVRSASRLGLLLFLVAAWTLAAAPSEAQRWSQRAQVITPIERDQPVYLFLDSLVQKMETSEGVFVRRSPSDRDRIPLSNLQQKLLDDGLGLLSASHAFIQYDFSIVNDQFIETVEHISFIYRSGFAEDEDVALFTVSTNDPLVAGVLEDQGLPISTNLRAVRPFAELISFPRLIRAGDTKIVQVNGETVREDFDAQRDGLTAQLMNLVYDEARPFFTRTMQPE